MYGDLHHLMVQMVEEELVKTQEAIGNLTGNSGNTAISCDKRLIIKQIPLLILPSVSINKHPVKLLRIFAAIQRH